MTSRILLAAAAAAFLTTSAFAADPAVTAGVTRPLQVFVDAFNAHQASMPKDAFTEECTVLDEFAPYVWRSAANWYGDLMGHDTAEQAKIRGYEEHVTIDAPTMVRVKGDAAYAVFPAHLDFRMNGKHTHQEGQWVVTELKRDGKWLISAHSWATTKETTD